MAQPTQTLKPSRFITLAAICIVVAALYFAQTVLVPLALAVLFCFLLTPLVMKLQKWGMARIPAVVVVVVVTSSIVFGLGWITTVQVYSLASKLPRYKDEIINKVTEVTQRFGGSNGLLDKMREVATDVQNASTRPATAPSSQPAQAVTAAVHPGVTPGTDQSNPLWVYALSPRTSAVDQLFAALSNVASPVGTAGLVLVFVVFMLIQREDLRDRMIRLMGQGQLHLTTTALDDAATRISRYMLAQAIVNGTYGVSVGIGLWAIGYFAGGEAFPSFVLWGLLCALLRFIPYIGPWVAAAVPIALSLTVYHGFTVFLLVTGMFVFIELISNNIMEPWLYGTSTGMSTVAILVSAVFWTWLWGPVGLLLATPLTVCLVVLGKYVPQLQFLDIMLGDEPVLLPPERVYQRLLALDQEEATDLARAYLRDNSLEKTYDDVLLPALAMAEQDRHRGRLNEERELFIMRSVRDMTEELAEAARANEEKKAAAENVAAAKGAPADGAAAPTGMIVRDRSPIGVRSLLPKGCTVNVVCLPAHDEGDDIANVMLAQLLTLRGYCVHAIPVAALASEMMDAVGTKRADAVVVSALPPGAVSYSRYLCKRLHARFPNIGMAVGLWSAKGDRAKLKERMTCAPSVQIAATLAEMLDAIHQMVQPILIDRDARQQAEGVATVPKGA